MTPRVPAPATGSAGRRWRRSMELDPGHSAHELGLKLQNEAPTPELLPAGSFHFATTLRPLAHRLSEVPSHHPLVFSRRLLDCGAACVSRRKCSRRSQTHRGVRLRLPPTQTGLRLTPCSTEKLHVRRHIPKVLSTFAPTLAPFSNWTKSPSCASTSNTNKNTLVLDLKCQQWESFLQTEGRCS